MLDKRSEGVGPRLRETRTARGISLRELARRLDISASALSQIETGKSRPSVRTLYAIVSELGISLDQLFAGDGDGELGAPAPAGEGAAGSPVQRGGDRASLKLDTGVTWERLTAQHDADVDFLSTIYDPGSVSSPSGELMRHNGREYHVVVSGELEIKLGFETYSLGPGDSISFDSNEPHMITNTGAEAAHMYSCIIGRRGSDPRADAGSWSPPAHG